MKTECIFCKKIINKNITLENETAVSFFDGFPVSKGHTLIIPKRHEGNFFNLNDIEQQNIISLMNLSKENLIQEFKPDGFNVGVNVGEYAGQTIQHAHLHLIPRFKGDVAEPKGGIRWIIPDKAPYWENLRD